MVIGQVFNLPESRGFWAWQVENLPHVHAPVLNALYSFAFLVAGP